MFLFHSNDSTSDLMAFTVDGKLFLSIGSQHDGARAKLCAQVAFLETWLDKCHGTELSRSVFFCIPEG